MSSVQRLPEAHGEVAWGAQAAQTAGRGDCDNDDGEVDDYDIDVIIIINHDSDDNNVLFYSGS